MSRQLILILRIRIVNIVLEYRKSYGGGFVYPTRVVIVFAFGLT